MLAQAFFQDLSIYLRLFHTFITLEKRALDLELGSLSKYSK
jgi:hypothetical protein